MADTSKSLLSDKGLSSKEFPVTEISQTSQLINIDIEKGQVDDREYQYLVLQNQLRVLLISDPQADKAAAALDVHVGSSDDPKDREGLAHFLEHMLFLGTEKYPEAAEYQAFIGDNAGSHNAYTSAEHTNYFFDIDADQLEPALDRFSQFFIAPLFDEEYVDRERNAVHSEYQAKIKDDFRRGYDVYRQQINPKHPYAKFSVGSLETLSNGAEDKLRDDLIAFYQAHYSSSQMTLVVLGKESVVDLQKMVNTHFSHIPLRDVDASERIVPLFDPANLPFEVISKPVKDTRQMAMIFPLPSVKAYYREKPLSYIGSLLGHEGEGSVLSLLKAKGWAEGLSAGGADAGAGNATFNISVSLTKEGVLHREEIRGLIFHALKTIESEGVNAWRYEEEQQLAEIAFQFREKGRAINTVSHLADSMHDYPVAEIISANYRYARFDEPLIRRLLAKLTPDNLFVSTIFPEVKTDNVTEKYQVPYTVKTLNKKLAPLTSSIAKSYTLPQKNIFIPVNISLSTDGDVFNTFDKPQKIILDKSLTSALWVQQDVSFNVPKANVFVRVQSPLSASSARHSALNQLLIALVNDRLNENSYPASLAGLSYSLSSNSRGFDLGLRGYNDKMPLLLSMLAEQVQQPIILQARFDRLKIEMLRGLRNAQKQTPYKQLFGQLPVSLFSPYYSDERIGSELETISMQELEAFASTWLQGTNINALVYGNVDKQAAALFQSTLEEWIQQGSLPLAEAAVVQLPLLEQTGLDKAASIKNTIPEVSLHVDHNDTAVGLYVQGVDDSAESQAKMVLLRQVLKSAFYSQLRTEQQLGYIVFMTNMSIKDVPGSFFVVQSPSASSEEIKEAVIQFLQQSESLIPEDLSVFKRSVATKLLETPQTLSAKAGLYWQDILKSNENFDYRQQLVNHINDINPQQLRAYYQALFNKGDVKEGVLNSPRLVWFVANNKAENKPLEVSVEQSYYRYP
ncbi:MAG: secreted Zn-dependent insulinase-like peptidase [Granulosicoccus sp.]|jgi:secreted Zn-dependent insulinase-like peptidase